MAWVTPALRATGDIVTAAIWNQDVKDNLRFLKGLDGTIALDAILNMQNFAVQNIGAAGTDFSATGGLTLADSLDVTGSLVASSFVRSGDNFRFGTTGPLITNVSGTVTARVNADNANAPFTAGAITATGFTDITAGGLRVKGSPAAPGADGTTTAVRLTLAAGDNSGALNTEVILYFYRGTTDTGWMGFDSNPASLAGVASAAADLKINTAGSFRAFFDNSDSGRLVLGGGLRAAGQQIFPDTGSAAGILLGGDVQLYRDTADVLRTPDSIQIDGGLFVGLAPNARNGIRTSRAVSGGTGLGAEGIGSDGLLTKTGNTGELRAFWANSAITVDTGVTCDKASQFRAESITATVNGTLTNHNALFLGTPSSGTTVRIIDTAVAGCFLTTAGVWTDASHSRNADGTPRKISRGLARALFGDPLGLLGHIHVHAYDLTSREFEESNGSCWRIDRKDRRSHIGYFAEELNELAPVLSRDGQGVDPLSMTAFNTVCIQALLDRVSQLQSQVQLLQAQVGRA